MGSVISISGLSSVIGGIFSILKYPIVKFYGLWDGWLWKIVLYIGIPLYIFGMLLAIAFSGGYLILLLAGLGLYYMYIKKMLNVQPIEVKKQENA